jgi:AcrR family transcriptional regulator
MESVADPARRTQAQRSAETRAALLEATVDCLAEVGYAATTTRRIAERAGVTPGALQHHFASKAELIGASATTVGERMLRELTATELPGRDEPARLVATLLDRAWQVHTGPHVAVIAELHLAARHDAELRARLAAAQHTVVELAAAAVAALFPAVAGADQGQRIRTVMATLLGLAIGGYADPDARDAAWPATRDHLLALVSRRDDGEEQR